MRNHEYLTSTPIAKRLTLHGSRRRQRTRIWGGRDRRRGSFGAAAADGKGGAGGYGVTPGFRLVTLDIRSKIAYDGMNWTESWTGQQRRCDRVLCYATIVQDRPVWRTLKGFHGQVTQQALAWNVWRSDQTYFNHMYTCTYCMQLFERLTLRRQCQQTLLHTYCHRAFTERTPPKIPTLYTGS